MHWSWPRFVLTLLVGLICALIYYVLFRDRGKRQEEVIDRVVEESSDESTKIKTLVDSHNAIVKAHDGELKALRDDRDAQMSTLKADYDGQLVTLRSDSVAALARVRSDHDSALSLLKSDHAAEIGTVRVEAAGTLETDLAAERAETERLRALVAKLENSTQEVVNLQGQIETQKTEYARLESDWKAKLVDGQVALDAEAKNVAACNESKAKLAADFDAKQRATEADVNARVSSLHTQLAEARAATEAAMSSASSASSATSATSPTASESSDARGAVTAAVPSALIGAEVLAEHADHTAGRSDETPAGTPTAQTLFSADGHSSDDLLVIEGIGPAMNEALVGAGITTFAELAGSTEERLVGIIEAAGHPFAPSLGTWAHQAEYLANGDQAGFDEYVKFLDNGREPAPDA